MNFFSTFFGPHPYLFLLLAFSLVGIFIVMRDVYISFRTKKTMPLFVVLLLIFIIINFALSLWKIMPFPPRHLREFSSLIGIFSAYSIISIFRVLRKKIAYTFMTLFILIGIFVEIEQYRKYEKLLNTSWEDLTWMDWVKDHLPPRSRVLTDNFTFHFMSGVNPYIQPVVPYKQKLFYTAQGEVPKNPTEIIFFGEKKYFEEALSFLCPDYVIVNKINTQQFYPLTLQINPEKFQKNLNPIYDKKTSTNHITIFERKTSCEVKYKE